MESQSRNALKVGILMLIWLVILVVTVFSITDQRLGQRGYTFVAVFENARGIRRGAPVQYAGVEVGEVKNVRLAVAPEATVPHVELEIWLPTETTIRHDAEITIDTFGLLGETMVNITPEAGIGALVRANEVVHGVETATMSSIVQRADGALVRFNTVLDHLTKGDGTLGKLVATDELHQHLVDLIIRLKEFVADVKKHPWKLLRKPSRREKEPSDTKTNVKPGSRW